MKKQIKLATKDQVVLMSAELIGQISDGYWENASPRDHWRGVWDAEIVQADSEPCVTFYPRRAYNFANAKLIEYVGDRMLQYVKVARAFPALSLEAISHTDSGDCTWQLDCTYYPHLIQEYKDICGVNSFKELQALLAGLGDDYKMKDLKKDLKAINAAFKNVVLV